MNSGLLDLEGEFVINKEVLWEFELT